MKGNDAGHGAPPEAGQPLCWVNPDPKPLDREHVLFVRREEDGSLSVGMRPMEPGETWPPPARAGVAPAVEALTLPEHLAREVTKVAAMLEALAGKESAAPDEVEAVRLHLQCLEGCIVRGDEHEEEPVRTAIRLLHGPILEAIVELPPPGQPHSTVRVAPLPAALLLALERMKRRLIDESAPEPVTPRARLVLDILRSLPPEAAFTGEQLLVALAERGEIIDKGTLSRHLEELKPYGLRNKPRIGYYLPVRR